MLQIYETNREVSMRLIIKVRVDSKIDPSAGTIPGLTCARVNPGIDALVESWLASYLLYLQAFKSIHVQSLPCQSREELLNLCGDRTTTPGTTTPRTTTPLPITSQDNYPPRTITLVGQLPLSL